MFWAKRPRRQRPLGSRPPCDSDVLPSESAPDLAVVAGQGSCGGIGLRRAWSLPGLQGPVEDGAPACGEVVRSLCEVAVGGGVGVCGRRARGELGDPEGFFVGDGGGVALFVVTQAVFDGAGAGAVHGGDVDVAAALAVVLGSLRVWWP